MLLTKLLWSCRRILLSSEWIVTIFFGVRVLNDHSIRGVEIGMPRAAIDSLAWRAIEVKCSEAARARMALKFIELEQSSITVVIVPNTVKNLPVIINILII